MMGTGAFAVPTFQKLYETTHQVVALVTRPDRAGPGRKKAPPNLMRDAARVHGTQVMDPTDVNVASARAALRELRPDLLVVCDFGQILGAETLAIAPRGGLNLHASLLPKYRGAAPVNWAIYHGEKETGNTVIHMTPQIDAGPCVAQQAVAIDEDETAIELEARLAVLGAQLVVDTLTAMQSGDLPSIPQDQDAVTRAPKLKKSDGEVDWHRSALQIRNQVRAMQPWPKTYTHWLRSGEPLRLILAEVTVDENASDAPPGGVVAAEGDRLVIGTGDGGMWLRKVQPAGKRPLAAEEFLRGYPVQPGDRFGNP